MENILEVRGLFKNYGTFRIENISFEIPRGTIVGLIGQNGAGKTTIIKSILDVIKRDAGEIKIFNKNLGKDEIEIKNKIGVVLDGNHFPENLRAQEISKILRNIYRDWSEDAFVSYLDKFAIDPNKEVKEYSKGMKMKLSIAVALSHDPELLILDEPTSGLDPIIRVEILDELLEFIQDENKSILFSTHITSDLDKIADYILFVNDGKIIINEEKDKILDRYGIVKVKKEDVFEIPADIRLKIISNKFGVEILIDKKNEFTEAYPEFIVDDLTLEDLMYFYIKGGSNEGITNKRFL